MIYLFFQCVPYKLVYSWT